MTSSVITPRINSVISSVITPVIGGGGPAPFVPCPDMNFVDAFALNSSADYNGMEVTITNNGAGGGAHFGGSLQNWISATGKVSLEVTFDSSTDLSGGRVGILLGQAGVSVVLLEYFPATGILSDINGATLATISPTIGQFTFGFTLDQATGTATYSYKLSNATSATANASLDVAVAYDNTISVVAGYGCYTQTSAETVFTINVGQAEYKTNVDGVGYCNFPSWVPSDIAGLVYFHNPKDLTTLFQDSAGTTPVTTNGNPLGLFNDSENSVDIHQTTADNRPTYGTDGVLSWVDYDGTNDCLFSVASLDLSATDEITICTAVRSDADALGIITEFSVTAVSNNGSWGLYREGGGGIYRMSNRGTLAVTAAMTAVTGALAAPNTCAIIGTAPIVGLNTISANGTVTSASTSAKGTTNYGDYVLYSGARANASSRFNGLKYTEFCYDTVITGAADLANINTYLKSAAGIV